MTTARARLLVCVAPDLHDLPLSSSAWASVHGVARCDEPDDLLQRLESGGYEIAMLDAGLFEDLPALLQAIANVLVTYPDRAILVVSRQDLAPHAEALRTAGVVDVISGAELGSSTLVRSIRLAELHCERHQAARQEARRQSARISAARLLRDLPHVLFAVGLEGAIEFANRAATDALGESIDLLRGSSLLTQIATEHRLRMNSALERAHAGQSTSGVVCRLHAEDGRAAWAEFEIQPWQDRTGVPTGAIVLGSLMEARNTMRTETGALAERLATTLTSTFDTLPVGILVSDAEGCPRLVNRTARDLLGIHALLPFARLVDAKCLRRPDGSRVREMDFPPLQTLRDGKPRREVELHIDHGTAAAVPVLVNTDAVRDADGRVVEVAVSFTDITERNQIADQLVQAQKMEAIGALSGGIAHDFNNILCAVLGYSELLRQRVQDTDPSAPLIEEIQKAGDRAALLTRQLLTFSRREDYEPSVFDLTRVVENIEKMLRRLIGEDVVLNTHLTASPTTVQADPGRIEQVVLNLALNARDALPRGGTIQLSTGRAVVGTPLADPEHKGLPHGEYAVLSVADDGVGIPADVLPHIFEPFFTTKARDRGTGLGLSTVHDIVKRSAGHIRVSSPEGAGTTFRVYLPLVASAPDDPETGDRDQVERVEEGSTVLLVEDECMVRNLMRELLELRGHRVIEAVDGAEALACCAPDQPPFELVVTDVVMPKLNGFEMGRRVHELRPNLPILYVSGYTPNALERYGTEDHASDLLRKPFAPADFIERIESLLERRDATGWSKAS
jgi:PAS domain S-box-containing protein